MLINPLNVTEYSLISKRTSSTSTESHFRQKIQHFFLTRTRAKIPLRMHQNAISSEKFNIFGEGPSSPDPFSNWSVTPSYTLPRPTKPSGSAPASARIGARFTPLSVANVIGDQSRPVSRCCHLISCLKGQTLSCTSCL